MEKYFLKVLPNDLWVSGKIIIQIPEMFGQINIEYELIPKTINISPKNTQHKTKLTGSFSLLIDKRDLLSWNYRNLNETKIIGNNTLFVKSKDCASVKCTVTNKTNDLSGEILFDTHGIFLTIWRLDLKFTNQEGKEIKLRAEKNGK